MGQNNGTPEVFLLELEAEPRYVATARLFAAAVARHYRCEEERVQDIKVAISEACSNSIKAHQVASVPEPVKIVARRISDALSYEVIDSGPGFEYAPSSQPPQPQPSEFFEGGVGLVLIQALFPDVEIESTPGGGTTVRFVTPVNVNSDEADDASTGGAS